MMFYVINVLVISGTSLTVAHRGDFQCQDRVGRSMRIELAARAERSLSPGILSPGPWLGAKAQDLQAVPYVPRHAATAPASSMIFGARCGLQDLRFETAS